MNCRTCIFWNSDQSWIEELPLEVQFTAGCTEARISHCRRHSPNTYIVPEPNSPKGFKVLSLFPVTAADDMCGDYVEDGNRIRSKVNDN